MSTISTSSFAPLPAPASATAPVLLQKKHTWRGLVILWVIVGILLGILLANNAALDTYLWRSTRWFYGDQEGYSWAKYHALHAGDAAPLPFYVAVTPPFTRTLADGTVQARLFHYTVAYWQIFKDFGETFMVVLLVVAVSILHRWQWKAGILLAAGTAAAGLPSWLIRIVAGRFRPVVADGANHWELFRGFHDGSNLSFPSGHATVAFATAAVLTYLAPRGKWLYLFIAAGTALSRVVMQAHFYSDVIMAGALGWTIAWLVCVWINGLTRDATLVEIRLGGIRIPIHRNIA